jgi:ATP-dependent protease ClpP protease subunit
MNNGRKMIFIGLFALGMAGAAMLGGNGGAIGEAVSSVSFKRTAPQNGVINLAQPSAGNKVTGEIPKVSVLLSKNNTITFRSQVDGISVAKTQQALLNLHKKLPKGAPIFLVLDTPGGDIVAGNQLIDTAHSLNRPVHTITVFAASMGFSFVQRLGTRYILPAGTLMAHRARVSGVEGQIPGEFITAAATLYNLVLGMERNNANRMGISMDTYTSLVKDEYWVDGEEAVRQGSADSLAYITCDSSLDGTSKEVLDTFFGSIELEWSNCPAVTQPLGFAFIGQGAEQKMQDQNITRNIKELLTSRRKMFKTQLKY